ncbi:MAG: phosphotransferase family protein [Acidimicrobiales bacterium]|nr:phosphotransferase family protein [Acidimicrobiales bacterium]
MDFVGLDVPGLTAWFAEHAPDARPPLVPERLAGGNSNLTYAVTDAEGRRFVVRRPPLHGVLVTANDMGREWRAITALQPTPVPVPTAVGFCEDPSVIGAPFFVTAFVEGLVHHDLATTEASSSPAERALLATSAAEVLADLHAVDPDAPELTGHGRRGRYLERQLDRWDHQYRATAPCALADMGTAVARLREQVPPENDTVVVHGDFRLGNLIAGQDGAVAAVVDWELSTLGDPLADLGFLLATWARPGSDVGALTDAATAPSMADGFPDADEVARAYALRSGRDLSRLDWYVAFNHWRFACIVQGVVTRARDGALGDTPAGAVDGFRQSVAERAALAVRTLDRA